MNTFAFIFPRGANCAGRLQLFIAAHLPSAVAGTVCGGRTRPGGTAQLQTQAGVPIVNIVARWLGPVA